jgi:hypothetical protein
VTKIRLSDSVWKFFLSLLLVAAASLIIMCVRHSPDLLGPAVTGDLGLKATPENVFGSRRMHVDTLQAHSPLAAAGVKAGELIEFQNYHDIGGSAVPGETVSLNVHRNGATVPLTVQTVAKQQKPDRAFALLNLVYFGAGMLFAALVGFKRADSMACRALSFFFVSTVFTGAFWIAGPGLNLELTRYANSMFNLTWGALALFAILYPDDRPTRLRAKLARFLGWYIAAILLTAALRLATRIGYFSPGQLAVNAVFGIVIVTLVLASLWDGWRNSNGEMRQRQLWLLAALGPFAVLAQFTLLAGVVSSDFYHDFHYVLRSWAMVTYLGLGYAVLRYRVFNFGFAVNRALLFTIISTLLLIVFGIVEFAVDRLLHFHGRQANIIVDAMVALGVILTFHRIQRWVGHKVDHTFFKHWHDATRRLRHFIATAVHINDSATLLERFVGEVDIYTSGTGTAVYGRAADGAFALRHASLVGAPLRIDANATLLLDLRHAQGALETGNSPEAHGAALVIPITARGVINGMILVGQRKDEQMYRPDQVKLLGEAVHHLGLDLESLRVEELEKESATLAQHGALLEREASVLRRIVIDAALEPTPG